MNTVSTTKTQSEITLHGLAKRDGNFLHSICGRKFQVTFYYGAEKLLDENGIFTSDDFEHNGEFITCEECARPTALVRVTVYDRATQTNFDQLYSVPYKEEKTTFEELDALTRNKARHYFPHATFDIKEYALNPEAKATMQAEFNERIKRLLNATTAPEFITTYEQGKQAIAEAVAKRAAPSAEQKILDRIAKYENSINASLEKLADTTTDREERVAICETITRKSQRINEMKRVLSLIED